MNCIPHSAAAQHMEKYIEHKLSIYNYKKQIWLSTHSFFTDVECISEYNEFRFN